MSTEHVVVPVEPCPLTVKCGYDGCDGCLGDGRRALLDQAVPVERSWHIKPWAGNGTIADEAAAYEPFTVDPLAAAEVGSKQHWAEVES